MLGNHPVGLVETIGELEKRAGRRLSQISYLSFHKLFGCAYIDVG